MMQTNMGENQIQSFIDGIHVDPPPPYPRQLSIIEESPRVTIVDNDASSNTQLTPLISTLPNASVLVDTICSNTIENNRLTDDTLRIIHASTSYTQQVDISTSDDDDDSPPPYPSEDVAPVGWLPTITFVNSIPSYVQLTMPMPITQTISMDTENINVFPTSPRIPSSTSRTRNTILRRESNDQAIAENLAPYIIIITLIIFMAMIIAMGHSMIHKNE